MGIIPKVATGVISVGGITGGGILAFRNSSKEVQKVTLSKTLTEEGFNLMKDSDSQWSETLKKYNEVKGNSDEVFYVSTTELTEEQLKERCRSFLEKEIYLEEEKIRAIRWCTSPISVENRINKLGRRVLNDEDNNTTDKDVWTDLVKKHLDNSSKNKLGVTITALDQSTNTVDDARINIMRGECKKLKVKTSIEKSYLEDYSKFFDWCSVIK